MATAGYFASVLIGVSLGLIGGGGSILTVPVLVYLFGVDAVLATTYSLFVVGISGMAGSVAYFRKKLVSLRIAAVFGLPAVLAVFLTRNYLLPAIPEQILPIGSFVITKRILLMGLFGILMLLAAYGMIRKKSIADKAAPGRPFPYPVVWLQGILVGTVTGLVGAGGGFLIIPALVNFLKLPMKKAVGTSLLIIAVNSLSGFLFSLTRSVLDWPFLLTITAIAIAGILAGSYLSTLINGKKLKPAFGWFTLAMGIYVLLQETLFQ